MNKLCFNKALLLTLITAFIFSQWSATHIHLSSEHQHDGNQHKHAVTAHQHTLDNHHTDNIDPITNTLSHSDSSKIIELEQICTQFHGKLGDHQVITAAGSWNISTQVSCSTTLVKSYQEESYQPYYQYSSIRLRAPPLFS